jgi:hypothetical protein
MSEAVLPTGRKFGRGAQKGPSKKAGEKSDAEFGKDFPRLTQKGPNF